MSSLRIPMPNKLRVPGIAVLFAVAPLLLVAAGAALAQEATESDHYYASGRETAVDVYLDRIGAIARDRITAEQVRRFAETMKLTVLQQYSGGMYILRLARPGARSEMLKAARDLRGRGLDLFRETGLVVREKAAAVDKDGTPMVMTDEFVVLFKPEASRSAIDEINRKNQVEVVKPDPFIKNQFLMKVSRVSLVDALRTANLYQENPLVSFAHPNFWEVYALNETIPNDPLFPNQWHHRNTGASGGTAGADAQTSDAWDLTLGSPNVLIGIVDNGFDITHEDLQPNLFTNPGEIAGNGADDDGNGFVDDVNGWDFIGNDNDPRPAANGDNHGTAVAGVAAARGGNNLGVSGACPNCRFLPLTVFANCTVGANTCASNNNAFASAINYAAAMGARIVNNSWGQTNTAGTAATVVVNAINNAAQQGALVLFAAGNQSSAGWCSASYPSLVNVMAVSSASNRDRKVVGHAFGNCIDVLAPTRWSPGDPSPTGTLAVTTTDRTGTAGYNNTDGVCIGGLTEPTNTNYTNCFSGTSSATPLTSGISGLLLSVNGGLNRWQLQRLIQDTSDKIEDSVGAYATGTGFSGPGTGIATHSWGRVNALEAVRIAAPTAQGGRGGVDVFLRDNRLDWGNTLEPSHTLLEPTRGFIPHWVSEDIKVDAPPYQTPPTAATFDTFVDENPSAAAGDVNRVYVRVRNRGPLAASSVSVTLHWSQFGTALPALPSDFWTAFPANSSDTSQWHPLNCAGTSSSVCSITNLGYSGSAAAGCPGRTQPPCGVDLNGDGDTADPGETLTDAAQIVPFDFPAPPVDPALANHFCLAAMIDSPQDPISAASKSSFVVDTITPTDNNVTHRNYLNLSTSSETGFEERFFVRNPSREAIRAVLRLVAPERWKVELDRFGFDKPFALAPGAERLVKMTVSAPESGAVADLRVIQEQVDGKAAKVMGGLAYRFAPEKEPVRPIPPSGAASAYLVGTYDLREGRRSWVHVINPTARDLRVLLAFFDDNEKPLKCIRERMSGNDLLEVEVNRLGLTANLGVVKVVALKIKEDMPEIGVVGNQRMAVKGLGLAETGLHPVGSDILMEDLKKAIWPLCR